jgi:hypothetical protein
VAVTVDNFVRAETDAYFASLIDRSGIGVFSHARTPVAIDHQTVIRMNRDTLYSSAVFDLDASPVTVVLPDAGERFMSMQVISEDHYTPLVVYEPGEHELTREVAGTRYAAALVRTLVDSRSDSDIAEVHQLQDRIVVNQVSRGRFEVPDWDRVTLATVRDTLKRIAPGITGMGEMFGRKDAVDPIRHLVGTAIGWGGNPERDATYVGGYPHDNDGATAYRLTVGEVPVDGFWSISVYNRDGFFEKNSADAYSVNSLTADRNPDGTVTIQFGGSQFGGAAGDAPNFLSITPGWNYVVRLYRPRPEILDGSWTFPEPTPFTARTS